MYLGSEVIILSADEARKLLDAAHWNRAPADYTKMEKLGFLKVMDELRDQCRSASVQYVREPESD